MLARLSSLFSRFFWPLLVILLAVSLTLVLWTGRPENAKYAEMACTFENRTPACIDSVRDWHEGLAFYDSSLSVTGDTLASLKALLWEFWNMSLRGRARRPLLTMRYSRYGYLKPGSRAAWGFRGLR